MKGQDVARTLRVVFPYASFGFIFFFATGGICVSQTHIVVSESFRLLSLYLSIGTAALYRVDVWLRPCSMLTFGYGTFLRYVYTGMHLCTKSPLTPRPLAIFL